MDEVVFTTEPTRYVLATSDLLEPTTGCTYTIVPGTEQVVEEMPTSPRDTRLVNSTVSRWLCSLHLVGMWLATSTAIQHWEEDGEAEDAALAELAELSERIRALDPVAYGTGDHEVYFWPAVLDRWLY